MEKEHLIYTSYVVFFTILVGLILATPLLAFSRDVSPIYEAFSYTCHQKLSRSLCVFSDGQGFWIADCTSQTGKYTADLADRTTVRVETDGMVGYKIPVCSRDLGLYAAMLFGGALYPVLRELKDRNIYPALYLIVALVPLAIDGSLQFVSDAGIISLAYESTNSIRLLTGAIAGLASAFYAIPVLINMFSEEKKAKSR